MLRQTGSLDAALLQSLLDLVDELLRVDRRERQVENALDGYGQTDHQAEQDREHPGPAALEELLHQDVVHAFTCDFGFCNDSGLSYGSSLLCECTYGAQQSNRHEKSFFHSCVR